MCGERERETRFVPLWERKMRGEREREREGGLKMETKVVLHWTNLFIAIGFFLFSESLFGFEPVIFFKY